jgi:hypothetical protein
MAEKEEFRPVAGFSQKAVLGLPQLTGQIRKSLPQLGTWLTGPVPVPGNPELLLKKFFRVQKNLLQCLVNFFDKQIAFFSVWSKNGQLRAPKKGVLGNSKLGRLGTVLLYFNDKL